MNTADFLRAAFESGVLSPDFRSDYAEERGEPADAATISDKLVAAGRLTAFQASRIVAGKADELVLGPYVLLDLLGTGGMGEVYRAEHRTMRRVVAVKVIKGDGLKGAESVRRFTREVQAAARLEHPNIVTAHDAGESSGIHYLAMQLVEGRSLAEIVRREGPQPPERTLDWILQAARGLAYAHGRGVVHRDIKPGNLLLDRDGTVKILDMGLARLESPDAAPDQLTRTGEVMGTVDFMAPEQAIDTRRADARSDVYSLGVTLWYLLTGRPLFAGGSAVQRIMAHQQSPPPSLADTLADIDGRLDAAFRRMVAKQPQDRFQSMEELIAALEPCVRRTARGTADSRWRTAVLPALAAAGVVAAFAASILLDRRPPAPPPAIAPPTAVAPFNAETARGHQQAWARHLGMKIQTTNSIGMSLVMIPPGRFTMGEGGRTAEVSLSQPYLLGRTEVTQGQWREVMGTEPWAGQKYSSDGTDVPATMVSWHDAVAFCERLTAREHAATKSAPGWTYRLPTEAEWEFACRAGTVTMFSFGDDESRLEEHAWHGAGFDANGRPIPGGNTAAAMHAHPGALKRPNPFGLSDMHGNVWEWVQDWHGRLPNAAATDPRGPDSGTDRLNRGGGWGSLPRDCRSANRPVGNPAYRDPFLGFRVATSPTDSAAAPAGGR